MWDRSIFQKERCTSVKHPHILPKRSLNRTLMKIAYLFVEKCSKNLCGPDLSFNLAFSFSLMAVWASVQLIKFSLLITFINPIWYSIVNVSRSARVGESVFLNRLLPYWGSVVDVVQVNISKAIPNWRPNYKLQQYLWPVNVRNGPVPPVNKQVW